MIIIKLIFLISSLFFFFTLSGMWDDDKASGHGILDYSNGDFYEGEWENDQRNGTILMEYCAHVPLS